MTGGAGGAAGATGGSAGAPSSRPGSVAFGADVAAFASRFRVVVAFDPARRDVVDLDPDRADAGLEAGRAVAASDADCGAGFVEDAFVALAPALRVDRFFGVAIASPFAGADGTRAVDC